MVDRRILQVGVASLGKKGKDFPFQGLVSCASLQIHA